MFRHLRTKLTVLYAGLFAATLALIALAALGAVSQNARQMVRSDLTASGAVFERVWAQRLAQFQNDGVLISHDFGFRGAVASRDVPTIRSALQNLKARLGIDTAFLVMPDRSVIAADDAEPALDPRDRQALEAEGPVSGVLTLAGEPYEAATIPIGDATQAGWLVFAARLDAREMRSLESMAAIPLTASMVYRDGAAWRQNRTDGALGPQPDPGLMDRIATSDAAPVTIATPAGEALALARPLKALTSGQTIYLIVAYPLATAMAPYHALLALLLVAGAAALGLVVAGSWALARTVTRPISQLEDAARKLQRGEAARVEVATQDEIGRLAEGFNAMAADVRERERELAGARDAAEAANRAKSSFLTNMSHELRTPLNGVIGVAGVLAGTPLAGEQRRMVGVIETSAQVLQRVLNDVLDLARVETGRMEIAAEPFDLGEVVRATAEGAHMQCAAKGLAFSLDADPAAMGWALGDSMRLQQILGNLIGNAVKFTEQGEVALTVRRRGDAGSVRFTVRDTGVGFDPAIAPQLFQPFQQADGSITRRFGGSGLGLSISRDLARAMGGDIIAAGTPGAGATFTVDVALSAVEPPMTPAEAPPPIAGAGLGADEPGGLRILVVDDHPTNRQVVTLILGSVGAAVTEAEDGQQAVAAYEAGGLDLILMDMQMPVMDGLTATRAIRSLEATRGAPRLPIVMLSANAMPEHVAAALASGADAHVAKPVTAPQLIGAVERALLAAGSPAAGASAA